MIIVKLREIFYFIKVIYNKVSKYFNYYLVGFLFYIIFINYNNIVVSISNW